MMTTILLILAGLGVLIMLGVLWVLCIILWVAKGEPDVNGDPERDSGQEDYRP